MKNIVIVNLIKISPYFNNEINGESQIDRILKYGNKLPNVDKIIFLLSEDIDITEEKVISSNWNEEHLVNVITEKSVGYDHLFYFFGDCPLLDSKLSNEMFTDHINYYAEYTFADGFPYGLTPEILDVNILQALKILAKDSKIEIKRDSIFNIIKRDINSFELETKIADVDLRLLRISLTLDTKRNYNQLKRVIDLGGVDSHSITKVLLDNPQILVQEPSFITIEITKGIVQNVTYLPKRKVVTTYMDLRNLDIILKKIKDYSDDATISFTPEYEPTTHPEIDKIIEKITNEYHFDLYIETSGLGWSTDLIEKVRINPRVNLIIQLDALDEKIYKSLRGDGQVEATEFTKKMITLIKNRVWVQGTRMKINESDMEPFYRYWQKDTDNIIIQKYSDYNGTLPNLKVADLSPLKRFPCWHLKKDLHINGEGEVLLCFNDITNKFVLGSLVNQDIEDIIERKKEHYLKHTKCDYIDFCRNCDEYYTFNF